MELSLRGEPVVIPSLDTPDGLREAEEIAAHYISAGYDLLQRGALVLYTIYRSGCWQRLGYKRFDSYLLDWYKQVVQLYGQETVPALSTIRLTMTHLNRFVGLGLAPEQVVGQSPVLLREMSEMAAWRYGGQLKCLDPNVRKNLSDLVGQGLDDVTLFKRFAESLFERPRHEAIQTVRQVRAAAQTLIQVSAFMLRVPEANGSGRIVTRFLFRLEEFPDGRVDQRVTTWYDPNRHELPGAVVTYLENLGFQLLPEAYHPELDLDDA